MGCVVSCLFDRLHRRSLRGIAPACVGQSVMHAGRSTVRGNQSTRPINQMVDLQKCGGAVVYLIGLDRRTRHEHATWRLHTTSKSRSEHSYNFHHSARRLWRLSRSCCSLPVLSWQMLQWSRPKLTNSTCDVSAGCACTYL